MRKVIIAMAILAGVLMSHGAACTWSASGISFQATGDNASSYVAYLVDSSISATDFITSLKKGEAEYVAVKDGLSGTSTARIGNTALASDARTGAAFVEDQKYSLYTLILNGDASTATHYFASAVKEHTPTKQSDLLMGFGNLSTGEFASAKGWQSVNIPEPTSGLLLLVGGALLALRRKQK